LSQLASVSKQLCETARSKVPVRLSVSNQQQAKLVIQSHAHGRPPFSGCRELDAQADSPVMGCLLGGVLDIAKQWTALEVLELNISNFTPQQQQDDTMEYCTSSLLQHVPAQQQLRRMTLTAPYLGTCGAQLLLQLTQLTSLDLTAPRTPPQPAAAAAAAADLGALRGFTNLVKLRLDWALAPHLPAGPEGPYCFPSSLKTLELVSTKHISPVPMAHWLAHLPGCPQLQSLRLMYGPQQHASAHPSHVVQLLARSHTQLRSLDFRVGHVREWGAAVAGLPDMEVPEGGKWQPNAALAALTGLSSLYSSSLCVRDQADWQILAQLTALTYLGGLTFHYAPPLQGGMPLPLLELGPAYHTLDGHGMGRLLLLCPMLQGAVLTIGDTGHAYVPLPMGPALPSHPTLGDLDIQQCSLWGDAAAARAQFAALAPVLGGAEQLTLGSWPAPSARGAPALPDLAPCTALDYLSFCYAPSPGSLLAPRQEDLLSMVAPLVQLDYLQVCNAPWVNPQVALVLQYMLPQLRYLALYDCGQLVDAAVAAADQQEEVLGAVADLEQEGEALVKVAKLLRPNLEVLVDDVCMQNAVHGLH
jgi:hypothetical protein